MANQHQSSTYMKWRKRVVMIMTALVPVGAATLWLIYNTAPILLFYLGIFMLSAQALATLACFKNKKWAYPLNATLSVVVLIGALSSPTHLHLLTNNMSAGFVIIVGNTLEVALLFTSLKAFKALRIHEVT
ncbi:MAG: hypothetical protein HY619_01845 [Thaumarchaeota archaeon]|nr:hypothetical protein [Nitrososphaerota archaeon]